MDCLSYFFLCHAYIYRSEQSIWFWLINGHKRCFLLVWAWSLLSLICPLNVLDMCLQPLNGLSYPCQCWVSWVDLVFQTRVLMTSKSRQLAHISLWHAPPTSFKFSHNSLPSYGVLSRVFMRLLLVDSILLCQKVHMWKNKHTNIHSPKDETCKGKVFWDKDHDIT